MLLAAPIALAPLSAASIGAEPAAAPMAASVVVPGACFALGLRFGHLVQSYRAADSMRAMRVPSAPSWGDMAHISDAFDGVQDRLLETPAVTLDDVLAKLLAALARVHYAEHDVDDLDSLLAAGGAIRDCVLTLSRITGTPMGPLGADFIDHDLGQAMARGLA
jgi:hypothetical protein